MALKRQVLIETPTSYSTVHSRMECHPRFRYNNLISKIYELSFTHYLPIFYQGSWQSSCVTPNSNCESKIPLQNVPLIYFLSAKRQILSPDTSNAPSPSASSVHHPDHLSHPVPHQTTFLPSLFPFLHHPRHQQRYVFPFPSPPPSQHSPSAPAALPRSPRPSSPHALSASPNRSGTAHAHPSCTAGRRGRSPRGRTRRGSCGRVSSSSVDPAGRSRARTRDKAGGGS